MDEVSSTIAGSLVDYFYHHVGQLIYLSREWASERQRGQSGR
jgi:hypothetical protein